MRELWETGVSDFRGEFFRMDDCRVSPQPSVPMKLICAGQSEAGMAFTARWADYNFLLGAGLNTPVACAPTVARMQVAAAATGRPVSCFALFMIIADETDAAALSKWEHYAAGVDTEAVAWMAQQGAADTRPDADTNVRQLTDAARAVNLNMETLVGSYAHVAAMLDQLAAVSGLGGVMLTFDDFIVGTETSDAGPIPHAVPPPRRPTRRGGSGMSPHAGYLSASDPEARILPARPEPLLFRPDQAALVVVDMQNAYASPGGYLDLAGFDISVRPPP